MIIFTNALTLAIIATKAHSVKPLHVVTLMTY